MSSEPRSGTARRIAARLHRYAGLFMAFFLIVAGGSGSLIAFNDELDRALNPELFDVQERPARVLTPDAIAARVQQAYPQARVRSIALQRDAGESLRVRVVPARDPATGKPQTLGFSQLFLDPYDGHVLGARTPGAVRLDRAHLMPFIYRLHYSLHIPGNWGDWLFGIVALVWMFDCFVGAYLTLPRQRPLLSRAFLAKWKPAWAIKAARLNYDLHRASGLWLWSLLFVLAMSGVYLNLGRELFRPVVGLFGELTPSPAEALPKLADAAEAPRLNWDEALQRAQALKPSQAESYIASDIRYLAAQNLYRVSFQEPGRGQRAFTLGYQQVYLDADSGDKRADYGTLTGTGADFFLALQFPMHSGQILGLPGRILICLAGLVTAALSVTGTVIWMRKRRSETVRVVRRRRSMPVDAISR